MEKNVANRRNILIGSGAAMVAAAAGTGVSFVFGSSAALAQQFDAAKLLAPAGGVPDHALGNKDAKVTVIEYLSPTCSHCKAFLIDEYPQLKAEYIDTNKIQFIPRPFVRNVLDAVVFMLAEAAGEAKYHDVVDTFFRTQEQWFTSQTPADAMFAIAQQLGFTKETYDAALTNQALFSGLETMRDQASREFQLEGTPTFYVNGKKVASSPDGWLAQIKAEIDPLLAA